MVTPKDFVHRLNKLESYRMTNHLIITQFTVERNLLCVLNQFSNVKSVKSGPHVKILTNKK